MQTMDAFEQLVSEILWMDGYWVRTSVKVNLTKEEKREIGIATAPRWELDIVAYSGRDNLLRVVECKSFLDSRGVDFAAFSGTNETFARRFKLFNKPAVRHVVFNRLCLQFTACGACAPDPEVRLALACGKIVESGRANLRSHFANEGWDLWDEAWLREKLRQLAGSGYENQVSAVVAKLLLRGRID
jgi:hypothetical protein